jgi:nitrate/nitrite transporter NarK
VLGGPISGAILQFFHGFYGLPGWKWLFLIEAIPAIVVGVWTLFYLDSGIRQAKWLNEGEKQLLERRIAEEASEKKEHPSLLLLFKDPRVWVLAWIYFGDIVGNVGLLFWMPTIVKGLGVKSLLNVGLITALPYVVAIFLAVILGTHSDRHRERRWHIAGPFFATAVALIGSVIAGKGHPVIAITALSIAAGSVLGAGAVFWAVPTALLAGTAAAAGIAAINSVGNLGGFFGPYIVGWIVDLTSSTAMGMCVVAAVQVAVGLTTLTLPRTVNK